MVHVVGHVVGLESAPLLLLLHYCEVQVSCDIPHMCEFCSQTQRYSYMDSLFFAHFTVYTATTNTIYSFIYLILKGWESVQLFDFTLLIIKARCRIATIISGRFLLFNFLVMYLTKSYFDSATLRTKNPFFTTL